MISGRDYDKRVIAEGLQFQAEHFYEPRNDADRRRIEWVIRHVDPRPGEAVLDVGCGTGAFTYHCAAAGARAAGLDYSCASLRAADILCSERITPGTAQFAGGHAAAMPFGRGSFDKAVVADVIEHLTHGEKESMFGELARVLRPGGYAVIFTPNKLREDIAACIWRFRALCTRKQPPHNELHFGLITRRACEKLLRKNGFRYVMRYYDVTRPVLARIPLVRCVFALNLLWEIRPEGGGTA